MYYTIYKTTNLVNGKYYIGKHQTENINDTYYGSGKAIKTAIKVYGKHNFKKEILFIFENEVEMNNKEKEIISDDIVKSTLTYNLGIGGEGGPQFSGRKHSDETKQKISESSKGKKITEETRKKLSNSFKGGVFSEDTKIKMSKSAKLRFHNKETRKNISESLIGHKHFNDSKQKMSDAYKNGTRKKPTIESNIKRSETMKLYHQNKKNKLRGDETEIIIVS